MLLLVAGAGAAVAAAGSGSVAVVVAGVVIAALVSVSVSVTLTLTAPFLVASDLIFSSILYFKSMGNKKLAEKLNVITRKCVNKLKKGTDFKYTTWMHPVYRKVIECQYSKRQVEQAIDAPGGYGYRVPKDVQNIIIEYMGIPDD